MSSLPKLSSPSEKELQTISERYLDDLEQGLMFVDHYVPVGPGIVDTLALDSNSNPVIIEYKAVTDAVEEALVQGMAYASWINKNPDAITRFISEKNPKALPKSLGDPRIILVAPSFGRNLIRHLQHLVFSPDKISQRVKRIDVE